MQMEKDVDYCMYEKGSDCFTSLEKNILKLFILKRKDKKEYRAKRNWGFIFTSLMLAFVIFIGHFCFMEYKFRNETKIRIQNNYKLDNYEFNLIKKYINNNIISTNKKIVKSKGEYIIASRFEEDIVLPSKMKIETRMFDSQVILDVYNSINNICSKSFVKYYLLYVFPIDFVIAILIEILIGNRPIFIVD